MSELHALMYVSTASRPPSQAEFTRLLERSWVRNAQQQVTGVLLYSHGNFMQYLEGPAEGIAVVYEAIKADKLHHGMIELLREPIAAREFSDWSMAFRCVSAFGMSSPAKFDSVFIPKIDPASAEPTGVQRLLWKFWNKGVA